MDRPTQDTMSDLNTQNLHNPTGNELTSRLMEISRHLNRRAEILKELEAIKKELCLGLAFCSGERESLDEAYTNLDIIIENERRQLLQATKVV